MKCPECVENDQRSRVYSGMQLTTAMGFRTYWDEDGVRHVHDPNTTITDYSCSNGHTWAEKSVSCCPVVGCEWNVRIHGVGAKL